MKIAVLTSSRADFGIYLPLLKAIKNDSFFELKLIVFGTHLSVAHGFTVDQIKSEGFNIDFTIDSMPAGDSSDAISSAVGLTVIKFSSFWKEHGSKFDYVLCLGDRYEMFAAVTAGIAFRIKFIHFHGGEKTLGAIDNIFRHSISHSSILHFTSTEFYAERLKLMLDTPENIYNVGSLSLQNIQEIELLTNHEFLEKWGLNLNFPTILMTFHPETVNFELNEKHANELVKLIHSISKYQFLITMPNADTAGNLIRQIFYKGLKDLKYVYMFENLGVKSYFSAMQNCSFLIGNTSSGIIEAASFGKYVINLGTRQEGRAISNNVITVDINSTLIQKEISLIENNLSYSGDNIYEKKSPSNNVIEILKSLKNEL